MNSFWKWLFVGSGAGPGLRRFLDWWLILHAVVGAGLALALPISLETAGTSLLLPIAGIFIGLSFAWGGNAQALLQTKEISRLSKYRQGGFVEYVFTYQAAVLLILISLCSWALAGLGIFDRIWPTLGHGLAYKSVAGVLFFLASMTVRECWHVVLGAQFMLLARVRITERDTNEG